MAVDWPDDFPLTILTRMRLFSQVMVMTAAHVLNSKPPRRKSGRIRMEAST